MSDLPCVINNIQGKQLTEFAYYETAVKKAIRNS